MLRTFTYKAAIGAGHQQHRYQLRQWVTRRLLSTTSFKYSNEVRDALRKDHPIVALESTIISHGMPYPENVNCAREVEDVVRVNGAVPATIAVLNGNVYIGMNPEELEDFGVQAKTGEVIKCSRRDLAVATSMRKTAGTTVAATMYLAHQAGIQIFATGGIGGVHRGAFSGTTASLDVSADLIELGRTPVTVVCAGIKSILDIGRSLEFLETQGVTVASVFLKERESYSFPSFFTDRSEHPSPLNLFSISSAVQLVQHSKKLGLQNGIVLAVPNPNPANESQLSKAIQTALKEATENEIGGKEVTPFLLKRVNELSGGHSLEANVALIKNNATVAAKIATELYREKKAKAQQHDMHGRAGMLVVPQPSFSKHVYVIGGANEDITIQVGNQDARTSNPAKISSAVGGVARNICLALARLAHSSKELSILDATAIKFVSVVAEDAAGNQILDSLRQELVDVSLVQRMPKESFSTGRYIEQVDAEGEMSQAFADTSVLAELDFNLFKDNLQPGDVILLDANLHPKFYKQFFEHEVVKHCKVVFETTSKAKSVVILGDNLSYLPKVDILSPNLLELQHLWSIASSSINMSSMHPGLERSKEELNEISKHFLALLTKKESQLLIKQGEDGASMASGHQVVSAALSDFEYMKARSVNSRGCGDTLTAAYVFHNALWKRGADEDSEEALRFAMQASQLTLQTDESVAADFSALFN